MASESTQHKIGRVRPPRVQISYDVEIGDAIQMKELPLVVGIMSDLAGQPVEPPVAVKHRKFVEIDRDNFNDVLKSIGPRLALRVENRLSQDESAEAGLLNVELNFEQLDDFSPEAVVNQVEPLRQLFEARERLADLISKLDGNDDLDSLLQQVAANTESLAELKKLTEKPAEGDAADAPAPAKKKGSAHHGHQAEGR